MLCDELCDSPLEGITYKEGKAYSHILDVIELNRTNDLDDDDDERSAASSHHDPLGYDEILQAIRAIIWSNVDLKKKMPKPKFTQKTEDEQNDGGTSQAKGSDDESRPVDSQAIEAELAGFEQLLTEVMMFKDTTANWSRNERLAYAEKFACKFLRWTNNVAIN